MKAGQQVTPTLKLTRLLGKGGMGSVWLADHLTLGTQVAIKFMSLANLEDQTLLQRFQTEAKAAAQIKHPHVAQVFDHGVTSDEVPYIVMEYLEGEDLKHAIRRNGPLPIPDVVKIVTQSARALARAHSLGIVHRDIKPDNIFLCNIDGEIFVKLLDFGVAKIDQGAAMNGATTTGSMMGTPLYMSPEQLLSARNVTLKSDLWSLAVVAYFALTGRVPFGGETIGSLSVAVHLGIFPPPSTHRPELSAAIDAWFARALKREPGDRYESAKEMADAFEAAAMARLPMPSMAAQPVHVATLAPTSSPQPLSISGVQYPAILSQSSPSTSDSQNIVAMPQATFSGTASDAGKRNGASKRQLMIAAGAAGSAVLLVGILVVAFSSGSEVPNDKLEAATQPDKPLVVQTPSALPAPPDVVVAKPDGTVPPPTTSASSKKSDKPTRVVTPPPPPTKTTTKTTKDTIGF